MSEPQTAREPGLLAPSEKMLSDFERGLLRADEHDEIAARLWFIEVTAAAEAREQAATETRRELLAQVEAALTTALSVVLHEELDPGCTGEPEYTETMERAAILAAVVMATPIVKNALAPSEKGARG